jgi:hypothetical protein
VKAVAVDNKFAVETSNVDVVKTAPGRLEKDSSGHGYLIADNTNSSLYALFALLKNGVKVYRLTGTGVEPGTIYITKQDGVEAKFAGIAANFTH